MKICTTNRQNYNIWHVLRCTRSTLLADLRPFVSLKVILKEKILFILEI